MMADKESSSLTNSLSPLHVSLTNGVNDNVVSSSLANETKEQTVKQMASEIDNSHVPLSSKPQSSSLPENSNCKDEMFEGTKLSISKDHLFESSPPLSSTVSEVDEKSSQITRMCPAISSTVTVDKAEVDQALPNNDQISSHSQSNKISTVQLKLTENNSVNANDTGSPFQPEKTARVQSPPSPLINSVIKSGNDAMMVTVESVSLPVRAEELPMVSPTVEDSQDLKELSQKPPVPVRIKVKTSGDDEMFKDEKSSVYEDYYLYEDKGSPPPLPERTVVVPPPLPPEESDDKESPPLPMKKMTDASPAVVPVSSQGEPKCSVPPPLSSLASLEDDVIPPLPEKKQSKEENISVIHEEEHRVLEARPIQSLPLSKVGSDSTSSVVSVPSATGSPTGKNQPPIPPRQTVSVISPPKRSIESDSDSPPSQLPKRKTLLPPPLPPSSNSDSDSESDEKIVHNSSKVAVKSVPLQDSNDVSSRNMLSLSKNSMETSDSSNPLLTQTLSTPSPALMQQQVLIMPYMVIIKNALYGYYYIRQQEWRQGPLRFKACP